ncbi:MAG: hypothetical protein IKC75_05205 [Clostridia bacterium]|nr:hypothetical protein [Clostridia bacterium]
MKKVLIALLLAALLVATVGCANNDQTPEGMQNVALESAKYYLYVPENWVPSSYNVSGARATPEENGPNVIATVHYPDGVVTAESYWSDYCVPEYTATLTSFALLEESTATLGGKDAKNYVFSYTFGDTVYQCRQVIAVFDFNVYVLTYTAVSTDYGTYTADVDSIVSNFTFK